MMYFVGYPLISENSFWSKALKLFIFIIRKLSNTDKHEEENKNHFNFII